MPEEWGVKCHQTANTGRWAQETDLAQWHEPALSQKNGIWQALGRWKPSSAGLKKTTMGSTLTLAQARATARRSLFQMLA